MKTLLNKLYQQKNLTLDEAEVIFSKLIAGELSQAQMAGLLIALKIKGEKPQEIAGAISALTKASQKFNNPFKTNFQQKRLADCCGTGGSGKNTLNISTMVALLLASMGIPMAKHGNRSISSKCGSADLLEQLGVKIDMSHSQAEQCLAANDFCFLFAPAYHPGIRHVMPVRNQLATRTIFNLIGPLINPAKPKIQLMGVYAAELCQPAAESLRLSGCESAMVVHCEGFDEITLHGITQVAEVKDNRILNYHLSHQDFGFPSCSATAIKGSDPQSNSEVSLSLLKGDIDTAKKEAIANTIAANAGALLSISDSKLNLQQACEKSLDALHSGCAFQTLQQVVKFSQSLDGGKE